MRGFELLGGFAVELRRRHVIRVTLVYGAVGWVVAQVSATILPALGVPPWSVSLVTVLLLLGLPVTAVLAWAYDLTSEGVRRAPARAARPSAREESVPAVLALPFVDRGEGGAYQYLGDGITEELINSLAGLSGVRVVSRTSAFALRGNGEDLRELGARLGVSHVVEGSIGVADGRLRLTVQLVCVSDGYATWSRTFDRALADVFCVQQELAGALAAALRPALLQAGEPVTLSDPRASAPRDFETYALYLRGRQQWNERTPAALRRALACFSEALERDPEYALAHAGVADCWAIMVDHGIISPAEGLPLARSAAAAALRLGGELPEVQASAALVRQLEWRWEEAEAGFRAALASNPGYDVARHRLALLLTWLGRTAEAREEMAKALRSDPLSPLIAASQGWIEYFAGNYELAIEIEQRVLAEHPLAVPARVPLALALVAAGRAAEAVPVLREAVPAAGEPGAAPVLALMAYVLGRAGRDAKARRILARLTAQLGPGYVSPYLLAVAWAGVGEETRALQALEVALETRAPQLVYLSLDPTLVRLRGRARVSAIVEVVRAGG